MRDSINRTVLYDAFVQWISCIGWILTPIVSQCFDSQLAGVIAWMLYTLCLYSLQWWMLQPSQSRYDLYTKYCTTPFIFFILMGIIWMSLKVSLDTMAMELVEVPLPLWYTLGCMIYTLGVVVFFTVVHQHMLKPLKNRFQPEPDSHIIISSPTRIKWKLFYIGFCIWYSLMLPIVLYGNVLDNLTVQNKTAPDTFHGLSNFTTDFGQLWALEAMGSLYCGISMVYGQKIYIEFLHHQKMYMVNTFPEKCHRFTEFILICLSLAIWACFYLFTNPTNNIFYMIRWSSLSIPIIILFCYIPLYVIN